MQNVFQLFFIKLNCCNKTPFGLKNDCHTHTHTQKAHTHMDVTAALPLHFVWACPV